MGTARLLFLGAATASGPGETLPRALWDRLRARDVRAETLLAAWEVSGWPDAPADERRALAALMVALGEAIDAGSTYLDLGVEAAEAGPAGVTKSPGAAAVPTRAAVDEAALAARLERLGFDAAEASAAVQFAGRLIGGDASPPVRALFGAATGERRPFVLAGRALYPEALWTFESKLALMLSQRLQAGRARSAEAPPVGTSQSALGPEQAAAVDAALSQPLTLITGGPGTGKTSTIVALLRALFRAGLRPSEIAVAAPTGRAAQRITESLRAAGLAGDGASATDTPLTASTVHRLLGLRPARRPTLEAEAPEYHAGWRLPHRFVIVDEASMLDLFMMTELAAAVRDDAHLILVGDADQLPSVRLGAVFRDLCAALPEETQRLTTSYRMDPADAAGAAILRVAHGLLGDGRGSGSGSGSSRGNGSFPGALSGPASEMVSRRRVQELTWSGVEHLPRPALPEFLARWSEHMLGGGASLAALAACRFTPDPDGRLPADAPLGPLTAVLERHARSRLLCVTRSVDDQTSAEAVNALLHAHFQRARRTSGERASDESALSAGFVSGPSSGPSSGFLPGEPVTILRNDYQRGLWNGDQGVVVALAAGGGDPLAVAFSRGDGLVVYGLGELGDNVGLGYAQTVHKAQGSEYDRVALVLPAGDGPLLTREILYTALTRARRSVVVVGDLDLFAAASQRRLHRASGLRAKLAALAPPAP